MVLISAKSRKRLDRKSHRIKNTVTSIMLLDVREADVLVKKRASVVCLVLNLSRIRRLRNVDETFRERDDMLWEGHLTKLLLYYFLTFLLSSTTVLGMLVHLQLMMVYGSSHRTIGLSKKLVSVWCSRFPK